MLAAEVQQADLGLDDLAFAVHTLLDARGLPVDELRSQVLDAANGLPDHRNHPEQRRELRLRLYGTLLDRLPETEIGPLIDDLLNAGL